MAGWIKLHRQVKDKPYYKDSEFIHLWIHLLLCANHSDAEVLSGYDIVKLKKGQFITGRKKLSLETGISESKIERILKVFEIEQQIEQQTNSRNRVISIVSWDKYQESEQQMNSKWTASGQQVNTNNNDKKKEEGKEVRKRAQRKPIKLDVPTLVDFMAYAKTLDEYKPHLNEHIERKYKTWIANNWMDGNNNEILNWKTKLLNTIPYIVKNNPQSNNEIKFPR